MAEWFRRPCIFLVGRLNYAPMGTIRDRVCTLAIELGGGVVKLAKQLRVTRGAVSQWRRVPQHHVFAVEALTGITRYELRPDIYGEPPRRAPRRSRSSQSIPARA